MVTAAAAAPTSSPSRPVMLGEALPWALRSRVRALDSARPGDRNSWTTEPLSTCCSFCWGVGDAMAVRLSLLAKGCIHVSRLGGGGAELRVGSLRAGRRAWHEE